MKKPLPIRSDYRYFLTIPTSWVDNDVYRHVNNVVYYFQFDAIVARFLLEPDAIDIRQSPVVGVVVETLCRYHAPISFPDTVTAGLRVERIDSTSIRYGIAIFREDEQTASAAGYFVHVYVDRATLLRPTPVPDTLRAVAATVLVTGSEDEAGAMRGSR